METKEEAEGQEDRSRSSIWEINPDFQEAVNEVVETRNPVQPGNTGPPRLPPSGHRHTRSEFPTSGNWRSNSFHRLKIQMQKAWQWGGHSRDDWYHSSFNPEVLANQKRQWYQLSSKSMDHIKYRQPESIFEHFIIVGIHPDANLGVMEEDFARRKKWEMEMKRSGIIDLKLIQHRGPPLPTFEPQMLFKYPPGKSLAMRTKDLANFCFPGGVKGRLLERTPSLSDLNELLYGQEHLSIDDSAFIFKLEGNATIYGVCLHVLELVQRQPGILGVTSPPRSSGACCQFMVSAPRCYCLLTKVPFFELHYEMLNSIIAQERLNRITEFVNEMSLSLNDYVPSATKLDEEMNDNAESLDREYVNNWMASAIPVNSSITHNPAAGGLTADDEVSSVSLKMSSALTSESVAASDVSDLGQVVDIDRDGRKNVLYFDDNISVASGYHSDASERINGNYENEQASPEIGTFISLRNRKFERVGSSPCLFSPARSLASEDDDDDDLFSNPEKDFGDDLILEWARENKNDILGIVCAYHAISLPPRGSEIIFQPLEHLQAIEYVRLPVSALGVDESLISSSDPAEVDAKLAAAEEAFALSVWTVATICRVLSLDSILAMVVGVLLEKQVVVICPNLGVLSAVVLSMVPLIRPFQWQSLCLPVLPMRMLDFLDAPVPFLVGLQHKPMDLKMKTSNLVQVNVHKNQVKTCHLPTLPRHRELESELGPIHSRLSLEGSFARKHPTYRCNEVQAEAATEFLEVMRQYFESLCADLRSHTITSVESSDRVSLLLKDSFIDSFHSRDRPFIKLFVDTQLFSALSDYRLSTFEHEPLT
ncbi:alcohol dehydrogenase class-3 [Hibiscus syriacus]|uniref:Alcohol dehydrogenase class-3 n=1 Tax=Hibiscus syriacus TaxID=106335 RepID=A0A6A2YQV4_HIBSY|nr:uncharacterized protein LOC120158233 [Hibiscus syriacus]XP_039025056.1 uncharacterized protein LOC120158233 [Hibiscus syriacus]KAE8681744.1 alcohol dehydrogenase class-3 [Hibiscus syriacus]